MSPGRSRWSPGFSWPALIGLAALAAPRVVLHDLGIIEEGSVVNGLFVFVPPACWIAAVVWKRPHHPFATVVVIGAIYGVFLALGHQLLWDAAFGGVTPVLLGGELADTAPAVQESVLRAAAVVSSVVTGTVVGVVSGIVAVLLRRLVPAAGTGVGTGPEGDARGGRRP